MGMLMYEDMKVSVLQLLNICQYVKNSFWLGILRAVGILLFFSTYITNIKGQGKLTVRGEKWCSRQLRGAE